MSEQNCAHVRRIVDEVFNGARHDVAHELYAEDCEFVDPAQPPSRGVAMLTGLLDVQRRAMPDLTYTIEDLFSDGDRVAMRWQATGTHQGELMGFAATGRVLTVTGLTVFRVADGKVRQVWQQWDTAGFVRQCSC